VKRDLSQLTYKAYDLLVIGGGIYGACVARDAALRGLSVALVEKGDFCSATSANSLKVIHGGLRYLQHGDLARMRASIRERTTLMKIAPHLVHPLPVLLPTYRSWMQSKNLFSLALAINDLIGFDRNRSLDPQKHIPKGRIISKNEFLKSVPPLGNSDLTGAALFYDAQVYNSERLVISFLCSAANAGAHLANYVQVTGFVKKGTCVTGVDVRDLLGRNDFTIQARMVVNTSGPWVYQVQGLIPENDSEDRFRFAKAINLVTRPILQEHAIGVPSKNGYRDRDAVIRRGDRYFFLMPWRDRSLIGTHYLRFDGQPESCRATEEDIENFLDEINQAYPSVELKMDDVSFVHAGLLPISGVCNKTGRLQLAKHPEIRDHSREGLSGLISVIGVKYTTARYVAEKVVDKVFKTWDQRPPKSLSSKTPVHGGEIDNFEKFLHDQIQRRPCGLTGDTIRRLIYNYGSSYKDVLRYVDRQEVETVDESSTVLRAQVLHGIRNEMAQKLSDVVFRRTELGTAGHPGNERVKACAETMGAELGWSGPRCQTEIDEVNKVFRQCWVKLGK